jgi:TolA-binding protein
MVSTGISIILAGIVYILLVKRINREKSSTAITEQVRNEIDRMVVDLNQTADRNIGLIEQQLKSLTEMIQEADHRISLLQKHSEKLNKSTDTYNQIRPAQIIKPKAPTAATAPPAGEVSPPNAHTVDISEEIQPGTSVPENEDAQDAVTPSKRERVINLYRQGISLDIIASRVDSTVAEVELIISMTEGRR